MTGTDVLVTGNVSLAMVVGGMETVVVVIEVGISGSVELVIEFTDVGSTAVAVRSVVLAGASVIVVLTGMGSTETVPVVVGAEVKELPVSVTGLLVVVCSTGGSVKVELVIPSAGEVTVVGTETGTLVEEVRFTTASVVGIAKVVVLSVGDGRAVEFVSGILDEAADDGTLGVSAEVALMIGIALEMNEIMGSRRLVDLVVWLASGVTTDVGWPVAEMVASVEAFSAGVDD